MDEQTINTFFAEDPGKWIEVLPEFQKKLIFQLLQSGLDYSSAAQQWANASTENTFNFGATTQVGDKGAFLSNLGKEVRAYICGDKQYKKERDGLFGEKGVARTYIISAISVAIAPKLGVAAAVISPLVALTLASIGKVTLNAWCKTNSV